MKLRDYQKEILEQLERMDREEQSFSTIVNLPTGGGKTAVAVEFCCNALKEKKNKVLWMADRKMLLEQAYDMMAKRGEKNLQISTKDTVDFSKNPSGVLATVESLFGLYKKKNKDFEEWIDEKAGGRLYIIYDEAHHIGAECVYRLFTSLLGEESVDEKLDVYYHIKNFGLVGLTATVFRNGYTIDKLKGFFKYGYSKKDKKEYKSESAYGDYGSEDIDSIDRICISVINIEEMIEKKYLVKPELYKVCDFENTVPYPNECKENMEYLKRRIIENKSEWGKLAVIVNKIDEAKELKEELGEMAIRCTSDVPNAEKLIEDFKNDKSNEKILITVHKFDEGIDVPELNTIYLYAKTESPIILKQRIGRVLRKSENGKDARVVWQSYPSKARKEHASKIKIKEIKKQDEEECKKEYEEWKRDKTRQLPAYAYIKPLDAQFLKSFERWVIFQAIALFGETLDGERIGRYYNRDETDGNGILVREAEHEGYEQYRRLIQNDWNTILRLHDEKNISFEYYAEVLGVSEDALLEDIKKVCFYMPNNNENGSKGKQLVKRLFVKDSDLRLFFSWTVSGKLEYEEIKNDQNDRSRNTEKAGDESSHELSEQILKEENATTSGADSATPRLPCNKEKKYTQLLRYGVIHQDNYREMKSKHFMMRAGITDIYPRVNIPELNGDALCGLNVIKRKSDRTIEESDWLLYASALVEMPNHIFVTQDDVDEYKNEIIKNVLSGEENQERAVKECLLALGYHDNIDIIKKQCEKFKRQPLPKLLQYVIYAECYSALWNEVRYVGEDGKLKSVCQNEEEIRNKYVEMLGKYGISDSQMDKVNLIEDIIYDYRPYLKAVPYYQGIKPEFLCRMNNDLIQLNKNVSDVEMVVDAFGGSGACSMNGFYKEITPKQVYNDLGVMNTDFYKCLKDKKLREELENKIQEIFQMSESECEKHVFFKNFKKYVSFELDEENKKKTDEKNESYRKLLECATRLMDSNICTLEDTYIKKYNAKVDKYTEKHKDNLDSNRAIHLEDRLERLRQPDADCSKERQMEKYFHTFMMELNAVYLVMTNVMDKSQIDKLKECGINEVDLAVVFFFYNTLSHRHFYNDCTYRRIDGARKNYKIWLGYGAERFEKIDIERQDALELMKDSAYNLESTVWYLDIPYTQTDTTDYVEGWFDEIKFFGNLNDLKGSYIVSSRCNICLDGKYRKELTEISEEEVQREQFEEDTQGTELRNSLEKEFNVFRFFSSFLKGGCDEVCKFIEEALKREKPGIPYLDKNEATYILIPYTQKTERYEWDKEDDNKRAKGKKEENLIKVIEEENASVITEDYVRRMIASTHFSNIPVDVMITNIEIDVTKNGIWKVYDSEGNASKDMFIMPTFQTGIDASQYKTEPVVIIMKYPKFMSILCSLLYHDEWMKFRIDKNAASDAEKLRKIFNI